MRKVFVDTSALYALLVRNDDCHKAAATLFESLLDQEIPLITHSFVVVELVALLQSRVGLEAVAAWKNDIQDLIDIEWINDAIYDEALQALLQSHSKKLSFVDQVSFAVMKKRQIQQVFAFDTDFETAGFKLL